MGRQKHQHEIGRVSRALLGMLVFAGNMAQAHDLDITRLPNHHIRLPATHVTVSTSRVEWLWVDPDRELLLDTSLSTWRFLA
jgi:hypothetical protein